MDDVLSDFVVQANMDGEMTLEHWPINQLNWCHWDVEVKNGTGLPELASLARAHLADRHPVEGTTP